ncbi:unnamed protein product [Danaus chrysippus]|uniref:(African queen) hypothetical protein n=1 Tax=Danaus chrysippus TaxID=151541 RepID=A0A8J2VVV3_9NEOP|nr:unnamed protein product [Danaus chrysippus]
MVQTLMAELKVLIGKRIPPPSAPIQLAYTQPHYTRRDLKANLHRHMSIVLDRSCKRRARNGHTRAFMEDRRCATCEALGRRSLTSKLLQVATAQAHMKTCTHFTPTTGHVHDTDLASRALAAKRRKSIAGFKLSLSSDTNPKTAPATTNKGNCTRRNTWCS